MDHVMILVMGLMCFHKYYFRDSACWHEVWIRKIIFYFIKTHKLTLFWQPWVSTPNELISWWIKANFLKNIQFLCKAILHGKWFCKTTCFWYFTDSIWSLDLDFLLKKWFETDFGEILIMYKKCPRVRLFAIWTRSRWQEVDSKLKSNSISLTSITQ